MKGKWIKVKKPLKSGFFYFYPVGAEGFEPPTLCL
nr:MAG TPA: hypothetical protein [Caudoviricetes sp.]